MSKHGFSRFGFSDKNFEKGQQEYLNQHIRLLLGAIWGGRVLEQRTHGLIINPRCFQCEATIKVSGKTTLCVLCGAENNTMGSTAV